MTLSDDWKTAARRKMHPPSRAREWSAQLDLPAGTDPLVLVPDGDALARELAPEGWVAVSGGIGSGKGCSMAPRWLGWYVRLTYRPAAGGPSAPDWYVTDHAVSCFERLHRIPVDDAIEKLEALAAHATFRERVGDLEVWRSPRNPGGGLRWLVDPRPRPPDTRARVIWVGYGNPPQRLTDRT